MKLYKWQDLEQTGIDENFSGAYYYNAAWEYTNGDLIYIHGHYSYFSDDGGETWTKNDIDDDIVGILFTHAGWDDGGDFYIATDIGVLVTSDNGNTWARKGDLVDDVYDVWSLGLYLYCRTKAAGVVGWDIEFRKYIVGTNTWDLIDTADEGDDAQFGTTIVQVNKARTIAYIGYYTTVAGDVFRFGKFDGAIYTETWSVTTVSSITFNLYGLMKKSRDCEEMFWIFETPAGTPQFYITTDYGDNFTLNTNLTINLKTMGVMRGDWETESDEILIFVNYYTGVTQNYFYFYFLDKPDNQQVYYFQDCKTDLGLTWGDMLFPTEKIFIGNDTTGFEGVGDYYVYKFISDVNEVNECVIEYDIYTPTIATIINNESYDFNRTLLFYDDSDVLAFLGIINKKMNIKYTRGLFKYDCLSFDREFSKIKFTKKYISQILDIVMRDIIDINCQFGYYDSSIDPDGDFVVARDIEFKNTVLRDSYATISDYEDAVWWKEPGGKIWCKLFASLDNTGYTINQSSGHIVSEVEYEIIQEQINKVHIYGGYVNGVRLEATAEDPESLKIHGRIEYVDHFPHIHDQTQLDNLAAAILAKTGMADNPIYIKVALQGLGTPKIGQLLNFQFTPETDLAVATNYLILSCRWDAKNDIGFYTLCSGSIQKGREYDIDINKISTADEEQIDNLAQIINSVAGGLPFYLQKDASADIAGYLHMCTEYPDDIKTEVLNATITADDQLLEEWATEVGCPGITELLQGIYSLHCHTYKFSGTKDIKIYYKLYKRVLAGAETLLGTSVESETLEDSESEEDIHMHIDAVALLATDRLVLKLYANLEGTGSNPVIYFYVEGDTLVRLQVPVAAIQAADLATKQTSIDNIILEDQKASGSNGGTFTSGAWRTRTLNQEVSDINNLCTLAGNQFTLSAGTYEILASAPGYYCNMHKAILYNATDSSKILTGTSEYSGAASASATTRSFICGIFTIAASKALEIRHRCATTKANDGMGTLTSLDTEVFTIVRLKKIG